MHITLRGPVGLMLTGLALTIPSVVAVTSAVADGPTAVKINEVESSGGVPGDWIELYNTGTTSVDLTGYVVKDNDDTHRYVIPSGSVVGAGGYLVVEEAALGFGLGAADSARLFTPDGLTVLDTYTWTAHAATTYGRCPNGTGAFATTTTSTKGAANDCSVAVDRSVKINEVESSGGTPGDWVELINTGSTTANVSGYVFKDNDDTHSYVIPAGTTIPAGGYLVLDEASFVFGLGAPDSARLYAADGTTLLDSYSWTAHAGNTYGRCPNGTGEFINTFAPSKGATNVCAVPAAAWPGSPAVTTADPLNVLGGNMSGLAYEGSGSRTPGVLWAVKNGPGMLHRLVSTDGVNWAPDTTSGWGAGKKLHYPDGGSGDPDAEGVAFTDAGPAAGIYVSTERDNSKSGVSRPEILLFDPAGNGTDLNAQIEWNLTPDLPGLGANLGLEAIEWISDSYLVSQGFLDEKTGTAYNPANYADHGDGLFFVGVEANGMIYAYALNHVTSGYTRIAAFSSGFPSVMDLEFEPETNNLWAECDDTCNGRSAVLKIAQSGSTAGKFGVTNLYERPATMPNVNNEGFAIAPRSECVGGLKPAYWTDDNNTGGNALRRGLINCTDPVPAAVATTTTLSTNAPATVLTTTRVTLTATVAAGGSAVDGGTVRFLDGTTVLGNAVLTGGTATLTVPAAIGETLKAGTHQWTAAYLGTPAFAASVSEKSAVTAYFTDLRPGKPFAADALALAQAGVINGFADGTFRPGATVDRQTAAAFLYRISPDAHSGAVCGSTPHFKDVAPTDAFCAEVEWAAAKGITTGYSDGTFRRGLAISREATAAFLYRATHPGAAKPVCTTAPFVDVAVGSAFCGEIAWMKEKGISTGSAGQDGRVTFDPAKPVSRQAFAAFLNRLPA